jgi:hypothetical protein
MLGKVRACYVILAQVSPDLVRFGKVGSGYVMLDNVRPV